MTFEKDPDRVVAPRLTGPSRDPEPNYGEPMAARPTAPVFEHAFGMDRERVRRTAERTVDPAYDWARK